MNSQKIVRSFVQLSWGIAWMTFVPQLAAASVRVGAEVSVENLTLFPVHGDPESKPVALTSLEAALAKGDAEVRELGGDAAGRGAEVNKLTIANKGKLPIYVLAGTIVKGGKQDRQISQDYTAK